MSNIVALEKSVSAGKKVQAIVPTTMDEAFTLAKAICRAGMAPRGMDTPEKAMIAIMRGMEVGLTPMMALDKIAIVNGRPTIWGDGAIGLARASGLVEYVKEYIEGDGEHRVAVCEAKRKGEPEPVTRKFSVTDARKAGLWGKSGPWQQFPERMLQMRARGFALRDGFADVLGGLYLKEEFDGVDVEPSSQEVIGAGRDEISGAITAEQVATLRSLCGQLGKPDAETTLGRYFKVDSLDELPAALFDRAVTAIKKKLAEMQANV